MKKFYFIALIILLSSCINVSNSTGLWEKGYVDKSLIGVWKAQDDYSNNKIPFSEIQLLESKDGYLYGTEPSNPNIIDKNSIYKTINIGNLKFLMINSNNAISLMNYEIVNNEGIIYKPNTDNIALADALKDIGIDHGMLDVYSINALDNESISKILKIYSNKSNLVIHRKIKKIN